jgi:hypothetical protein
MLHCSTLSSALRQSARHQRRLLRHCVAHDAQIHVSDRCAAILQVCANAGVVKSCRFRPIKRNCHTHEYASTKVARVTSACLHRTEARLGSGHHGHAQLLRVALTPLGKCGRPTANDVTRDVRIQHQQRHRGSRSCGAESSRPVGKSSGTRTSRAKTDAQPGFAGESRVLPPCLRT